ASKYPMKGTQDTWHLFQPNKEAKEIFSLQKAMSSFINVKNCGYTQHPEGHISDSMVMNSDLTRESSIHAMTFDELQHTLGGSGKDVGSMNMDEFLKTIWTSEETQTMGLSSDLRVADDDVNARRTFSRKTVDEVWRELHKQNGGFSDVNLITELNLQPQEKHPALGEMTLEEFLRKVGVVAQNGQMRTKQSRFGDESCFVYKGFHQEPVVADVRSLQQPKPQKILPKQAAFDLTSSIDNPTSLMNEPQLGSAVNGTGKSDHPTKSHFRPRSPSDLFPNSNLDTSPSPPRYSYGASGVCERSMSGSLEKVVDRRRKRMIKNRESAARSRARKQAYTLELEAEVEKLKKINYELQKKQEEFLESHNFQVPEKINMSGNKRSCLPRTLSGPW
ncbi:hypothetical protein M8C21_021240, partial [Ambrosia artemisiifolia]